MRLSVHDRVSAWLTLDRSPRTGYQDPNWAIRLNNHRTSQPYPRRVRITPQAIRSESPGGSGSTPDGCTRAHPLASRITPRRFYPIHPGARGLLSGTKYRGTQRERANNRQNVDASEQTRTRLHLLPNDRGLTLSHPTPEGWLRLAQPLRASSASPDP